MFVHKHHVDLDRVFSIVKSSVAISLILYSVQIEISYILSGFDYC